MFIESFQLKNNFYHRKKIKKFNSQNLLLTLTCQKKIGFAEKKKFLVKYPKYAILSTISSCHLMYPFQSESTLSSPLDFKKNPAQKRREI